MKVVQVPKGVESREPLEGLGQLDEAPPEPLGGSQKAMSRHFETLFIFGLVEFPNEKTYHCGNPESENPDCCPILLFKEHEIGPESANWASLLDVLAAQVPLRVSSPSPSAKDI